MDNIINQSSLSERENTHLFEVKKIKYTIAELHKLKENKYIERSVERQAMFHITCDNFEHSIEYYKAHLKLVAIDSVVNEIVEIIKSEEELLKKELYYLYNIIQEKDLKGYEADDDLIPALGSDNVIV